jgi:hypothetical protein
MRRDPYMAAITAEVELHGASIVETKVTGGGHMCSVIELNGVRRKLFYPKTPSDHRGPMRAACDARNLIRKMNDDRTRRPTHDH